MFLQLSVILFTGGLPQCMLGYHPPEADTPQKQALPGSRHPPEADTPPEAGNPPEAGTPLRSACWEMRSTGGRCASYWNAILLLLLLVFPEFDL